MQAEQAEAVFDDLVETALLRQPDDVVGEGVIGQRCVDQPEVPVKQRFNFDREREESVILDGQIMPRKIPGVVQGQDVGGHERITVGR